MSATRIYLPLDTAAVALGADQVATAILAEAKARRLDVNLTRNGSRGMVWAEPLLEVETNEGRIAYANVSAGEVAGLFEADFLNGGDHPLSLGLTENIDYLKNQTRITFARCGLIDPLSIEEYEAAGGLKGLRTALKLDGQKIVDQIKASGLRGRGGAGFPAGIKWQTVMDAAADQKYIVCNADEGDAGTFADRMIIEGDPFLLIEGMAIAGIATGATKGIVYLRSEYPVTRHVFEAALEIARDKDLIGDNILGSGRHFDLELFIGAGAYICGEETSLLESLEGKRGQVRAKPPIPALQGLFAKPTLVHNVISLCAAPDILADGGEAYGAHGIERSRGTMPFQLGGNIKRGGIVELPFGGKLRTLIEDFGGGTLSGRPFRAAQVGGPLGAYLPDAELDTPIDYEAFASKGAGVGHGGIIVFDDSVDLAQQARYAFEFCAHESCGKCTPCRIGAVRGVEVMDRLMAGDVDGQMPILIDLLEVLEDGSLCAMGGMTPVPVKSALAHFAGDFDKFRRGKDTAE